MLSPRAPRRLLAATSLVLLAALTAACGDDGDGEVLTASAATTPVLASEGTGTASEASDGTAADGTAATDDTGPAGTGSDDDSATDATASESDDTASDDTTSEDAGSDDTTPSNPDKPEVSLPDELPTDLVITDLRVGTGREAAKGDTVIVNYVGVRSEDGVEFDNSYDRGSPFSVTLGTGSVIDGWDQGLIGIQAGGMRQHDIPADLAYGDQGAGDVIRPGDAISFVVEAVAVLPLTDPADKPEITIEGGANVDDLQTEDLVAGDGPLLEEGQTAVLHLIAYRADTGDELASSWESGELQPVQFVEGGSIDGLIQGLDGMKVGGRRQITIPYALAFGAEGNEDFGLPAETDMILVVDLISVY